MSKLSKAWRPGPAQDVPFVIDEKTTGVAIVAVVRGEEPLLLVIEEEGCYRISGTDQTLDTLENVIRWAFLHELLTEAAP